jgi:hypothetical protein
MGANCIITLRNFDKTIDKDNPWYQIAAKNTEDIANLTKALNKIHKGITPVSYSSRIVTENAYHKGEPQKNPNDIYIFAENAEAATYVNSLDSPYYKFNRDIFPYKNIPKINVSDVNGTNQAGIRVDEKGNVSKNAYGIITKKFQHNAEGKFVAEEGQFQNTEKDFNLFKSLNTEVFDKINRANNQGKTVHIPSQLALGRAALPSKFVEWLRDELNNRFGIQSTIEQNTNSKYSGYGLRINNVTPVQNNNLNKEEFSDAEVTTLLGLWHMKTHTYNIPTPDALYAFALSLKTEESGNSTEVQTQTVPLKDTVTISTKDTTYKITRDNKILDSKGNDISDTLSDSLRDNIIERATEKFNKRDKKTDEETLYSERFSSAVYGDLTPNEVELAIDKITAYFPMIVRLMYDNEKARIQDILSSSKSEDHSPKELRNMRRRLKNLTPEDFMRETKASDIFNMVKSYISYCVNNEEGRAKILKMVTDNVSDLHISQKTIREQRIKDAYEANMNLHKNMIANDRIFAALAQDAITSLKTNAHIKVNMDLNDVIKEEENEVLDNSEVEETEEQVEDEEGHTNDYKQDNALLIDPYTTISEKVYNVFSNLAAIDKYGFPILNEIGERTNLDSGYVHSVLMQNLLNCNKVSEMKDIMRTLYGRFPWMKVIIDEMKRDPMFESEFFTTMQEVRTNLFKHISRFNPTLGTYVDVSYPINDHVKNSFYYNSWRDNINNGVVDSESTIPEKNRIALYDSKGEILPNHSTTYISEASRLSNELKNNYDVYINGSEGESAAAYNKIFGKTGILDEIGKLLRAIGINQDLSFFIANPDESSNMGERVEKSVNALQTILTSAIGIANSTTQIKGSNKDFINYNSGRYGTIARIFVNYAKDAIVTMTRQGKSTYTSFIKPNKLDLIIRDLSGENRQTTNFSDFERYMKDKFAVSNWFFNNGEWMAPIFRHLMDGTFDRKELKRKIVLNAIKPTNTMEKWNKLQTYLVNMNEYYSGKQDLSKSGILYAYYAIPVFGDVFCSSFLRMPRYVTRGVETYENQVLDDMVDVVKQEIYRNNLKAIRKEKIKNNEIKSIQYYDTNNTVFYMVPELNFDVFGEHKDKTFIEAYADKAKETNNDAVKLTQFIKTTLKEVLDKGFEKDFEDMVETGLFDSIEETRYNPKTKSNITSFNYRYFKVNDNVRSHLDRYHDIAETKLPFVKGILNRLLESAKNMAEDNPKFSEKDSIIETVNSAIKMCDDLTTEFAQTNNDHPFLGKDTDTRIQRLHDIFYDILNDALATNSFEYKDYNEKAAVTNDVFKDKIDTRTRAKDLCREYYYNTVLAQSNIIEMTVGDLAFFKNYNDFIKRFKSYYSPYMRPNTEAKDFETDENGKETTNLKSVGKTTMSSIFLSDTKIVSELFDAIKATMNSRVKQHYLSQTEADSIASTFKNMKVADSMTYRTPKSYFTLMQMYGRAPKEFKEVFKRIKDGTWDYDDFMYVFNQMKPFMVSNEQVDAGDGSKLNVPISYKNSEIVLMALNAFIPNGFNKKLAALQKYMEDNDIDTAVMDSAVKFGASGVIDLDNGEFEKLDAKTDEQLKAENTTYEREFARIMNDQIYSSKPNEDGSRDFIPQMVHTIDYSNYGEISSTSKNDYMNKKIGQGTQFFKLITADLVPEFKIDENGQRVEKEAIDVGGNNRTVSDVQQKFNDIHVRLSQMAYQNLISTGMFNSRASLIETFSQVARNDTQRYSAESIRNITKGFKDGMPLFELSQSRSIQPLFLAKLKKTLIKRLYKGGTLFQVSSKYMDPALKPRLIADYGIDEEGNTVIKKISRMECYLPAYMERYFKVDNLVDEHGNVDIEKLNANLPLMLGSANDKKEAEELRKALGYRIPTEGKASMCPLYIKGFLNAHSGSSIILPEEIVAIANSDFDIDKLFLIFPEITTRNFTNEEIEDYAIKRFAQDYADGNKEKALKIAMQMGAEQKNKIFESYRREVKNNPTFEKVKYDWNGNINEMTEAQLHNMQFDIMYGVLTSEQGSFQILRSGGYINISRNKSISNILSNATEQNYLSKLKDYFRLSEDADVADVIRELDRLSDKDLQSLEDTISSKNPINPLVPSTYVHYQQQNPVGKTLISIYAVYSACHAVLQRLRSDYKFEIKTPNEKNEGRDFSFVLNGRREISFTHIYNSNNKLISKTIQQFLGAAVDTAKDPTLAAIMQNKITAPIAMFLANLGYEVDEICAFFTQPVIKELCRELEKANASGVNDNPAIYNEILGKYEDKILEQGIHFEQGRDLQYLIASSIQNFRDGKIDKVHSMNYSWVAKGALNIKNGANSDFANLKVNALRGCLLYGSQHSFDTLNTQRMRDSLDDIEHNYLATQYLSLLLMKQMSMMSDLFSDIVHGETRFDSLNKGSMGPAFADILNQLLLIRRIENTSTEVNEQGERIESANYPFTNPVFLKDDIDPDSKNAMEEVSKSPLPLMQAYVTFGYQGAIKQLVKYFPNFNDDIITIVDTLRVGSRYKKLNTSTVNSIIGEYLLYNIMKTDSFGADDTQNAHDKRNYYINQFAEDASKLIDDNKDLQALSLLGDLKHYKRNKFNLVNRLALTNTGKLNLNQADIYRREWLALLMDSRPEVRKLAIDLFKYLAYTNGFQFTPNSWVHYAPEEVIMETPGYVDALNKVNKDSNIASHIFHPNDTLSADMNNFIDLYIRNHYDNSIFFSKINPEEDILTGYDKTTKKLDKEITLRVNGHVAMETQYNKKGLIPYARVIVDGEQRIFKFIGSEQQDINGIPTDVLLYDEVDKLGLPMYAKEYEYGNDNVTSVINRQSEISEEEVIDNYNLEQQVIGDYLETTENPESTGSNKIPDVVLNALHLTEDKAPATFDYDMGIVYESTKQAFAKAAKTNTIQRTEAEKETERVSKQTVAKTILENSLTTDTEKIEAIKALYPDCEVSKTGDNEYVIKHPDGRKETICNGK